MASPRLISVQPQVGRRCRCTCRVGDVRTGGFNLHCIPMPSASAPTRNVAVFTPFVWFDAFQKDASAWHQEPLHPDCAPWPAHLSCRLWRIQSYACGRCRTGQTVNGRRILAHLTDVPATPDGGFGKSRSSPSARSALSLVRNRCLGSSPSVVVRMLATGQTWIPAILSSPPAPSTHGFLEW